MSRTTITKALDELNNEHTIDGNMRRSGEIVASNRRFAVWGKRDLKTAQKLKKRIKRLGINYERIAPDEWDSFLAAFTEDNHDTGKKHTVGIEGNNCRLRHRIRRAFRRTCSTAGKRLTWLCLRLVILCGSPPFFP
jgi:IS1 family transposase